MKKAEDSNSNKIPQTVPMIRAGANNKYVSFPSPNSRHRNVNGGLAHTMLTFALPCLLQRSSEQLGK